MKSFIVETVSSFMVLFAVIDILGSVPIILKYKQDGMDVNPFKITMVSFILLLIFLIGGKLILGLFGVDISSFAIADHLTIGKAVGCFTVHIYWKSGFSLVNDCSVKGDIENLFVLQSQF